MREVWLRGAARLFGWKVGINEARLGQEEAPVQIRRSRRHTYQNFYEAHLISAEVHIYVGTE